MRIANDFAATRSAGQTLSTTGSGLLAAAARTDFGAGAGGDAAPYADAALGSLTGDWQDGLQALGKQVEMLGAFVDLVALAFEKSS